MDVRVCKFNEDKRLIFGFASVSIKDGKTVTDSYGDQIEIDVMEKAAYRYVIRSREGKAMHEGGGIAVLVESMVFTPEKLELLGLEKNAIPQGWWIGMRIDDPEVWGRVKSGELRELSIGGRARREEDGDEA